MPPTLRLVFWELTAACNLHCRHCRAEAQAEAASGELDTRAMLGVMAQIREVGDPILILSGGEPLLRPDFTAIARHACATFSHVALATNGTLVDGALADAIAGLGIERVSISLDGAQAETHDAFRGIHGSYAAALQGFQALQAAGLPLQLNITVTRGNHRELPAFLAMAERLGAKAVHLFLLVPVGCGVEIDPLERLDAEACESLLTWLAAEAERLREVLQIKATCAPQYARILRQRAVATGRALPGGQGMSAATRGCLAGSAVCFISRCGDVQPCGYLPLVVGNVLEDSFAELWRSAPAFRQLRDVDTLKGKCGGCEFRLVCQGCRARAYATSGDFLAEEPDCAYLPLMPARCEGSAK